MGKTCVERKVKVKDITESNAWHSIEAGFCLTYSKSSLVVSLFIAKQEMLGSGVVEVGRLFRNSFKNIHVRGHSVSIAAPPHTHTHTHTIDSIMFRSDSCKLLSTHVLDWYGDGLGKKVVNNISRKNWSERAPRNVKFIKIGLWWFQM
jgi:hypothetical protein